MQELPSYPFFFFLNSSRVIAYVNITALYILHGRGLTLLLGIIGVKMPALGFAQSYATGEARRSATYGVVARYLHFGALTYSPGICTHYALSYPSLFEYPAASYEEPSVSWPMRQCPSHASQVRKPEAHYAPCSANHRQNPATLVADARSNAIVSGRVQIACGQGPTVLTRPDVAEL